MRRLVSGTARAVAQWFREAATAWDAFWFAPADPTLLGLLRILTGLMLVYTHAVWSFELEAFFGPDGWLNREAMAALQQGQLVWSYWWLVPDDWLWPVHWAGLAVLVLFTLGVCTRVTSVLAFIVVVSYVHRVAPAQFGLDQINAMLTLYLAIGPSGQALSIDRLVTRRRLERPAQPGGPAVSLAASPSAGANFALRLIQVHMCVIYFFAGLSKLKGAAWWDGEAMWMAFANLEYQSNDMTWVAEYPRVIYLMTHTTVVWELTFAALVWRPLLRPIVLFLAVVLHAGIGAFLGMWTFGLIMLIGCASFLSPAWVASWFRRE